MVGGVAYAVVRVGSTASGRGLNGVRVRLNIKRQQKIDSVSFPFSFIFPLGLSSILPHYLPPLSPTIRALMSDD